MSGVNKIIILGRLGQDPETTYSKTGTAICKFSMATSEKINDKEVTQWHRITAFGKVGEILDKYVHKGDELYIEGKISYGSYEKDGITRYTTDIIVRDFNFISGKKNSSGQSSQNQHSPVNEDYIPDDDILF